MDIVLETSVEVSGFYGGYQRMSVIWPNHGRLQMKCVSRFSRAQRWRPSIQFASAGKGVAGGPTMQEANSTGPTKRQNEVPLLDINHTERCGHLGAYGNVDWRQAS